MVQITEVKLVDDLDGSKAVETVPFALDGKNYAIDLSKKNAVALRKAFEPYVEKGHKVKSSARKTATTSRRRRKADTDGSGGPSAAEVREWAAANGIEVPARGRLPKEVREQYDATH